MPLKFTTPTKGFTLIEILITVFILLIMLVFFQLAVGTLRLSTMQQHKEIVIRVIQQKIETLRASGYSGVSAEASFSNTQLNSLQNVSASTTVSDFNGSIKQVTVGISWLEVGSTTQYMSATTLLVNSGGI